MMVRKLSLMAMVGVLSVGCGKEECDTGTPGADTDSAGETGEDTDTEDTEDTDTQDTDTQDTDTQDTDTDTQDTDTDTDTNSGGVANLTGVVTRSAAIQAQQDGVGELAVWIMKEDPQGGSQEQPVGEFKISADFSASGAQVSYSFSDVPTRDAKYYVMAAFDDDDSGFTNGPEAGDLVSMNGPGSMPTVTMETPGDYTLNLDLSQARPDGP